MTHYILTKFNRNIIAIILAFLLLLIFTGDQTAARELGNSGGQPTWSEQSQPAIGLAVGSTFVVNSAGNGSDNNQGDGVCDTGGTVTVNGVSSDECTLQAAVQESNALAGTDTINFNVRNSDGSCPARVTINTPPTVTINDPTDAGVTINGYTQCNASQNTQSIQGNAVIRVELKGPLSSTSVGINIKSSNNTIKGLAVFRSNRNIQILGDNSLGNNDNSPARNNTIQGNFIGANASLSCCSYGAGVAILQNADYNLIGGVAPKERNILLGGSKDLINIRDKSDFNVVIGNYIGVKQDGKTKLSNTSTGMDIEHDVAYNWVGGSPPGWIAPNASSSSALGWPPAGAEWPPAGFVFGDPVPPPDPNRNYDSRERNVIGGNKSDGIEFSHSIQGRTRYNYVVNNYIGVSANGTIAIGNGNYGITVEDLPHHTFIYDNVISNNEKSGIRLYGEITYAEIVDNYIGVAPDGVTPMGNGADPAESDREGITIIAGSQHNLIKNNIIANHPESGVKVSTKNQISDGVYKYSFETFYNTISQNSLYNNQRGIHLGSGTGTSLVGNDDLAAPQITSADLFTASGTACANCTIEVFIAQVNDSFDLNDGGEGKTFIGQGTADGAGNFSVAINNQVIAGDKVTATATDALGNTSEFGPNAEVENAALPPVGSVLLNGGTGLQSIYTDVLAQFQATDNVSVAEWRYSVDSDINGAGWTTITPAVSPFSTQINPLTLGYGPHTVYAQYKDGDGNVSAIYNATITVVNIGSPDDPDNGQIIINNGAAYTNNPNLSLKLIAPIPTSSNPPFYTKDMKVDETSLSGASWEPYAWSQTWPLDGPPTSSKVVTMVARYRDANNTPTASQVTDMILFDPVSPTLSVSLDTNTKILDLSGSQDDAGGSGLGLMRIYDAGNHDSGWIAYQTSYQWPGPSGTIINVQLQDNAGNLSTISQVDFPSPDGAPFGTIALNGGNGLQSTDSDIVAHFEAYDDNAVAKWRYSVDSDINGVGWTTISPSGPTFMTDEVLSLSNGLHTVYVQYRDNNDQVSPVYNASITISPDGGSGGGDIYLPLIFR